MQAADIRTSCYTRVLHLHTPHRKLSPIKTKQVTPRLEQAAQQSIYQPYSVIYYSKELQSLLASKTHPTETFRNHLIGVAIWVLFLMRTCPSSPLFALATLTGQPGATPGPVEMEDPEDKDEPFASW